MNSTHHELSFELLHVGWHSNLQIFQFLLMSGTALSLTSLTQQLAKPAMNSTHHELSFELLHVGWNLYLQIFEILFMSETAQSRPP